MVFNREGRSVLKPCRFDPKSAKSAKGDKEVKDCSQYTGGNPLVISELNPDQHWRRRLKERSAEMEKRPHYGNVETIKDQRIEGTDGQTHVFFPDATRGVKGPKQTKRKSKAMGVLEDIEHKLHKNKKK